MLSRVIVILAVTAAAYGENTNRLADEVREAYAVAKSNILNAAEKMSSDDYAFRPAPRVRTFGQILGHLAEEHYLYCGTAKGEEKAVDAEKAITSKAGMITALKASFAYCDAVYDALTGETAVQLVARGRDRTRLRILWGNVVHENSHYGNLVTYMRIKGLVPPSTEGQ